MACGGPSDNTRGDLAAKDAGLWTGTLTSTFASATCPTVTADIKSGSGSLTGPLSATLNLALTAVVTDRADSGTDLLAYSATARAAYGSMALGAAILER